MRTETGMRITRLDPWMNQSCPDAGDGIPLLVGLYELDLGVDSISEALFLSGGPEAWELWAVQSMGTTDLDQAIEQLAAEGPRGRGRNLHGGLGAGLAVAGEWLCDPPTAAMELFKVLLQARLHHSHPRGPYRAGLLTVVELEWVVSTFELKLQWNWEEALAMEQARTSPILEVAMAYSLNVRPAGHNSASWLANCPSGRQHSIMISTSSDQFGCGYCRRKGGAAELERFCTDRGRSRKRLDGR